MEDDPRLYEIFREHLTLLRDGKEIVLKNSLPLVCLPFLLECRYPENRKGNK